MYARAHLFSIRGSRRALCLIAGAAACGLTAGCAANPFDNAKVDPSSPVAAEVARVANSNRPYPTFASIPAAPKDVRAPKQYGREAEALTAAGAELDAQTGPGTWSLTGTEDFAQRARTAAGNEPAPKDTGATAAFANTQRKRATPPPPPKDPR